MVICIPTRGTWVPTETANGYLKTQLVQFQRWRRTRNLKCGENVSNISPFCNCCFHRLFPIISKLIIFQHYLVVKFAFSVKNIPFGNACSCLACIAKLWTLACTYNHSFSVCRTRRLCNVKNMFIHIRDIIYVHEWLTTMYVYIWSFACTSCIANQRFKWLMVRHIYILDEHDH